MLARQDGPAILVGHSCGGTVITEARNDPKVAGLIYVAALAPDAGESTGDQFAEIPRPSRLRDRAAIGRLRLHQSRQVQAGFAADINDADAARIGAEAVEVKGSHVVFLSRPEAARSGGG